MQDQNDGTYYCERCAVSGQPTWRYLLELSISDFEGNLEKMSCFGDSGDAVLNGIPADQAHAVRFGCTLHCICHFCI